MATADEWTKGYARQANADFEMFQFLQDKTSVVMCHKLQFLQMACEKLVKAHRCSDGMDPAAFQKTHAVVARMLPVVLRQHAIELNFTGQPAKSALKLVKQLSPEIEILAPAVKRDGKRPDNCEYPWQDDNGDLRVPLDWTFIPALMVERKNLPIIRLIKSAILSLLN